MPKTVRWNEGTRRIKNIMTIKESKEKQSKDVCEVHKK